jgi:hypothetical protein
MRSCDIYSSDETSQKITSQGLELYGWNDLGRVAWHFRMKNMVKNNYNCQRSLLGDMVNGQLYELFSFERDPCYRLFAFALFQLDVPHFMALLT